MVLHPLHTGSDQAGVRLTLWGAACRSYYEKAMLLCGMENIICFASVKYALLFQKSAKKWFIR